MRVFLICRAFNYERKCENEKLIGCEFLKNCFFERKFGDFLIKLIKKVVFMNFQKKNINFYTTF